jgi:hypothetical protein
MGGFQTVVNTQPAPAVAGDFCNKNPRFSVDAGPGGLVAGDNGVVVGRFAWLSNEEVDANDAPAIVNNFGAGPVAGFVHRDQQGLITGYLQKSSMLIPVGFQMTLMAGGGFWARNDGNTEAHAPAGSAQSASVIVRPCSSRSTQSSARWICSMR